ncbi:proline/glycine betaine ABC transporter permease [Crassaminicella thermophila]|uniref:Proline/glycine betaine ABC transporter permease n=1 Tax=Crassaminicella thermophila TaxID=2599308 RepID=A0A5C0SI31_CRATE|nr:proline/glycine betaine ABC transporter permease [Crassaminicella thermophila]QEK13386.1 proline/glycine betaine ABC transporter permease [Crassaminicella thermophila]
MNQFPDTFRIELGKYVEIFVKYLTTNFGDFFDAIKEGILWFLLKIEAFLQWLPWWFVILAIFVAGWRIKKLSSGICYAIMLFFVGAFGLWELMMSTLAVVLTSVFISLLVGIPIGILMAYSKKIETIMKPILDGMQTMPSFVYLIPAIMLFGLGKVPGVFATTIYAVPPVIRLTNLAIRSVSKEMVEAAHSFGSSPLQILLKVELPQALPTIMTGVNQTTMMAMAMVVVASMIGAKGLGGEVLIAINRIDIAKGTEAGLAIVVIAIIIDRITQGIAERFKIPQ